MTSNANKTITIIGAGYVGISTAAIFANTGYTVHLLDVDQERLKAVKDGHAFFYEDGLNPLIKEAVAKKTLLPGSDYSEAVSNSQVIFSCVGTPDNPDGSPNLNYVFSAAKETAKYLNPDSIYVQKSTVPVGTGREIEKLFAAEDLLVDYVSNPEFLREGTALADTLFFDRIVVGGSSKQAVKRVTDIYRSVEQQRDQLIKLTGIKDQNKPSGSYIATDLNSAELIKVTSNAFLALKISFANSIAKLADHTNADVNQVMDAVGADHRIGRAFLNAGRGYGGGCFPKDVSGLISSANDHGVDMAIMTAAADVNKSMPGYIANKAQSVIGSFAGKRIAVLGLSFKAGTSDARRSPGVKLANILSRNGAKVAAYDPEANGEANGDLRKGISVEDSLESAVKAADAVFITTNWPEFVSYNPVKLAKLMSGNLFVDGMNCFTPSEIEKVGLKYIAVGRNGEKS